MAPATRASSEPFEVAEVVMSKFEKQHLARNLVEACT